jgi:hypothetical protein
MSSHQLNSAFTASQPSGEEGRRSCAKQYRDGPAGDPPAPPGAASAAAPPVHVHSASHDQHHPGPIAFTIGNFPVHWYGICYAVGLAAVYFVLVREARRRGEDPEIVGNALIIVAIAALIGGRLYHVIDQWALYRDDLITAILPISRPPTAAPADTTLGAVLLVGGLIVLAVGVALRSRDGRAGVAGIVLGVGLIAFVFCGTSFRAGTRSPASPGSASRAGSSPARSRPGS